MPEKVETSLEGLYIVDDFVTKDEERELINMLDLNAWCGRGIAYVSIMINDYRISFDVDFFQPYLRRKFSKKSPNPEMKRRTQHYGYEFSYRYRKVMKDLGPLPDFLSFIIQRFGDQEIIQDAKDMPNMCIVNEYDAGQGDYDYYLYYCCLVIITKVLNILLWRHFVYTSSFLLKSHNGAS
ncbi:4999_t:CDS:2 [Acaulospora colombiana]|uniref:4999_t:CDS:1 n=1 Tax=Acaulospora colombiana TaxID=27376 RepID=A0ACA9LAZ2_9GLOM|nr:4999_t:CDS:2 [Acaulospora colombiana]